MQSPEQLLQCLAGHLQHLGWQKTQGGVAYRFRCPYCQHDSAAPSYTHKGYIHPDGSCPGMYRFKCHACGAHSTLLDFVKEQVPELLLPPSVSPEQVYESPHNGSDGQKLIKLPRQKSISDSLWRSRHLPRHLYRGNPKIIKRNYQGRD